MKMSPHAYFEPLNCNDITFKCYFDDRTRQLMHWADLNHGFWQEFPDTPEMRADFGVSEARQIEIEEYDRYDAINRFKSLLRAKGNALWYIEVIDGEWANEWGPIPETFCAPKEEGQCPFCKNTLDSIGMHSDGERETQTLKCQTCKEYFYDVHCGDASALVHLPDVLEARQDPNRPRPAQFSTAYDDACNEISNDEKSRVHQEESHPRHKHKNKLTLDF